MIVFREGKFVSRVNVCSSKNKMLPVNDRNLNLPPANQLITLGNGAILKTQCWFLLLADWVLNSGCSPVRFVEWGFMPLNLCITSSSAKVATLFISPLGNDSTGWAKRMTGRHRMGHPIHWIIKIFFWTLPVWGSQVLMTNPSNTPISLNLLIPSSTVYQGNSGILTLVQDTFGPRFSQITTCQSPF